MKKQNGFIKILLVVIVLILIVGVYFIYSKKGDDITSLPSVNHNNSSSASSPYPMKELTREEDLLIGTADWKTFSKYGFEFKYPAEWVVKNFENMKYVFFLTDDLMYFEPNRISPKDSLIMNFSLMDNTANKYTIMDLAGCVDSEAQIIIECKDIIINGISYKRVIAKNSASEVGGLPIVLDQKYIKVVTVFNNVSFEASAPLNDRGLLDEKVILAKFDSILTTFKFIK